MAANARQHKQESATVRERCSGGALAVSLPVLRSAEPKIKRSKNSKRRAIILIAVQLLIFAHIALWLLSREFGWFGGKTLTPVEPSESMQSIELAALNAGAIFFAIILLSTLIFGRFFCGWACHIVMLQDFCAWIMKKCGVRPKPFRSRILIWVPLALGLYMFVWPTFKRWAVFPLLEGAGAESLASFFVPVARFEAEMHLTTDEFWATFPVIMAIPTLLIVGFAAVYFLGSKGFCTYGCPYGGFFAPLDEFAPGRIRVDHNKCHHCGHCTATCTSNVRVHEEVREYGMVVDPGCMKCMDCISVCPNDALYFGFGKTAHFGAKPGHCRSCGYNLDGVRHSGNCPECGASISYHDPSRTAQEKRPKKQYDLSWREDVALAVVFVLALLGVRGLYVWEGVPLLMSVGLAGVVSFLLFKSWRLFMKSHDIVRIQNLHLKWRGRITKWGWALVAVSVLLTLVIAQNGAVNAMRWRADLIERKDAAVPREVALSPFNREEIPAEIREAAKRALTLRETALGMSDGGIALLTEPREWSRLAWLHIVAGHFTEAEALQRRVIAEAGASDHLYADLIRIILFLQENVGRARETAAEILSRHPEFENVRTIAETMDSM